MSGIYHKGKEWANVTTPNPEGTASTDLTKVGIDGTNYNIKDANAAPNTPTFTEASTRANLSGSGESMATILGKIKKWFADLKDLAFIGKDGASSTKYLRGDGTWQAFPTIPTVNDKTLTIQKNGTQVAQFTANSASDVTANITVPTNTSDLTNDSGYVTADENVKQSNTTSSTVRSILLASNNSTSAATAQAYKDSNLKYKPSTQTLTAGTFDGIATKVKYEGNYGGAWISGSATANTEVTGSNDYIPTSAAVVNYVSTNYGTITTGTITKASRITSGTLDNIQCQKIGKMVVASGRIYSISVSASGDFFQIPTGFRPTNGAIGMGYIKIGSTFNPCPCSISTNGVVGIYWSASQTTDQVFFFAVYPIS